MKTIIIHHEVKGAIEFQSILKKKLPEFRVATSLEGINPSDVEVLIFWLNVPEYITQLKNLKLVLSCGSGIDHFIHKVDFPDNIHLVRLVDPYLKNRVSNYVLARILEHIFPSFSGINTENDQTRISKLIREKQIRVGVMGLGLIGESIANLLVEYGFIVSGWVKNKKKRTLSNVFVGKSELYEFAQKTEILVCQLPLTNETKGILNTNLFNQMPAGSFLINTGRGEHLVEEDLVLAIESGKLSGACLDVLIEKQLNENHPFHKNSKIKITPHIAGFIGPTTQAPFAGDLIKNFVDGKNLSGIVDYHLKY